MTRKVALTIAASAVTLFAAEVWNTKDYTKWSSEETQKILMNSPWAKETSTTSEAGQPGGNTGNSRRGGGGMGGVGGGGGMGGMGGGGMGGMGGGGMGGGRRGGGAPGGTVASQKVTIRWESALPEKEAQLKSQFGDHIPAKDDPGYTLDKPETMYRISVTGLQVSMPRNRSDDDSQSTDSRSSLDRMKDQFMGSTQLVRKGKDPIYPQDIKFDPAMNTITFLFPKSDAITANDKEVEFTTASGRMQLKRKFNLKEMTFSGKLEL